MSAPEKPKSANHELELLATLGADKVTVEIHRTADPDRPFRATALHRGKSKDTVFETRDFATLAAAKKEGQEMAWFFADHWTHFAFTRLEEE